MTQRKISKTSVEKTLRELSDRIAGLEARERERGGGNDYYEYWVIQQQSGAFWVGGNCGGAVGGWTASPYVVGASHPSIPDHAIRFMRRDDAERAIETLKSVWLAGSTQDTPRSWQPAWPISSHAKRYLKSVG